MEGDSKSKSKRKKLSKDAGPLARLEAQPHHGRGIQTDDLQLPKARDDAKSSMQKGTLEMLQAFEEFNREVGELKLAGQAFGRNAMWFGQVADHIQEVFWLTEEKHLEHFIYVSPMYEHIWGRKREALYADANNWTDAIFEEDRTEIQEALTAFLNGSKPLDAEYRIRHTDGSVHWIWDRGVQIRDEDGSTVRLAGIAMDITGRKEIEEQLILAKRIIAGANEAIVVTDSSARILDVNDAFCRLAGYSREELLGNNPRVLKSGRHDDRFYKNMWKGLVSKGEWQGEIWDRRKSGEIYPKLLSISAVKNRKNEITHYVGFSSDISEIKQTEERLQQLAHRDPLTGLANRILFRDRLEHAVAEAARHNGHAAVMLLDLDRFKNVNDTRGHPVGDQLLVAAAERLKQCVRETDTVSRLGGDEFAIVLSELHDNMEAPGIGQRVLEALAQPFNLEGREAFVSGSIGISVSPADGIEADVLLQKADKALYSAKARGRNNFQFFSQEMNVELHKRAELEAALRSALERNELQLHYQPVVDFWTGRIVAAEALLRWDHPSRGLIAPTEVIPLAEETGLILPLGEWVLRTACQQNSAWGLMGLPPLRVSVNLSARQLIQSDFVSRVSGILEQTGLDPARLELEMTEAVAMKDEETCHRNLVGLREKGIILSVDEFGTGYFSLSILKRLPVNGLKIDRSLLQHVVSYRNKEPILDAIVKVAHSLGLKVVAEGVENKTQMGLLWYLDCDAWQGYYFSGPVSAGEFEEMLRQGRRAVSLNFQWSPDLAVNVTNIDNQHKEWFRLVDYLCRLIIAGSARDEIAGFLNVIADYSRFHFTDEERLIQESGCPGYESQREAHKYIVHRIQDMGEDIRTGKVDDDLLVELVSELYNRFANHVALMDASIGEHLCTPK